MNNKSLFEIVRLIDLRPAGQSGFCLLMLPANTVVVDELRSELELQTGRRLHALDVHDTPPSSLIERLQSSPADVVVVSGLETWSGDDFAALDINRSRLETGRFVIFAADNPTAARLLDRAPNLRSFLATSVFTPTPDPSVMTPVEIEVRLRQLREFFRMGDEETVRRAEEGTLPTEPEFTEWLVLLGRGELVR